MGISGRNEGNDRYVEVGQDAGNDKKTRQILLTAWNVWNRIWNPWSETK